MNSRIYKCNLRGMDITQFSQNPIVLREWNYDLGSILGKAEILPGKREVEVTFIAEPPEYWHALGTATASHDYGPTELVALAIIPVVQGHHA